MDILEDEILVTKLQLGDQDAFDELMRRYKHRIYAYILRSVKNYEDAEELTIEVFFKVYRAQWPNPNTGSHYSLTMFVTQSKTKI